MLEAEVSRQILIDLEQQPDSSSPQLVLNLRPELYGVSGSTEQSRQRWYYLLNLRENRPATYRQILKNQRLVETTRLSQEAQSSKSERRKCGGKKKPNQETRLGVPIVLPKFEGEDSEEEEDSKKTNT
jgi:hypothetical protein